MEQWGFVDHLVFGGGVAVAGNGFLPWRYSAEGMHVTNAHGYWKAGTVEEKGISPLVWTERGARAACPAHWDGGFKGVLSGYSWQFFVPPVLCCDLLCLRCYRCCKKLRMPNIRRLRA